jgi:tetratricopeptide (TPR) repeat protein
MGLPQTSALDRHIVAAALAFWLFCSATQSAGFAQNLFEARTLCDSGNYEKCLELSTQGIEKYPYQEIWRHQKLDSELTLGRYADALNTVEQALEDFPTSIRLRMVAHRIFLHNNELDRAKQCLDEIEQLISSRQRRYRSAADMVAIGQYYLLRGADAREVLELCFDRAKDADASYLKTYLAIGELGLAKHDYELAADAYQAAARIEPKSPDVHFGRARAYAPSEPEIAQAALNRALDINPRHVKSLLFAADQMVDMEKYDEATELLGKALEVNSLHPLACAYLAVIEHLQGNSAGEQKWRDQALSTWPANPAVDSLIGRKLSQKYRFAEGASYQRRALAMDPDFVPAKIQLSQDLLRLGNDEQGWQLAADVRDRDGYNIVAYNLTHLRDTIQDFKVIEGDGVRLRMAADEADIYGQSALELVTRARRTLCQKYDVQLDSTVVEIYPAQKDFAIRTLGMPGGAGLLGVCFGPVITVNSPASQGERPANWQAVLWHEFCHTVTLHKTKNKMPRWLSEGISVYEEKQANPAWGQTMNQAYRKLILDGKLARISEMSGEFLQPADLTQLQFAYFQSALVVQYLVDTHGLDVLKVILDDLANGQPINVALNRHAGGLSQLEDGFARFARQQAKGLAPNADWSIPELPNDAGIAEIQEFTRQHPENLLGLKLLVKALCKQQRWEESKQPLLQLLKLYPEDVAADGALRLLADVHRQLGEGEAEVDVLEKLAAIDAEATDVFMRLVELHEANGDWDGVLRNANRMLAVDPLVPAPHRAVIAAAQRLDRPTAAIAAYRAVLRMEPVDPAGTNYELAQLLLDVGKRHEAKRHVLMALEQAPRYRDAQRLLLRIRSSSGQSTPSVEPEAEEALP